VEPGHDVPGLVRTLRILRERWWVIALATVACVAVAFVWSKAQTKEYTAVSELLFRQNNLVEQAGGVSIPADTDPEATKATNVLLVTARTVADAVRRDQKLPESVDDLLDKVNVESESNANVVNISVTDQAPARAAAIATSWAEQFVAYSQRTARDKVRQGEALIRQRLDALPLTATAERTQLSNALTRLVQLEAVQTGDADVLDPAPVPTSASSPRPLRNAAIALALGLLLGVGLAFLLNLVDRRIKSVEDFEELYGKRALGSIPQRSRDPSTQRERQAALEPFRILSNALGFLAPGGELRTIMVTSAVPGEGKSTVAAGLARTMALAGEQVVLVEADLRRPTFHEQFQVDRDPRGLTSALVGGVPVREVRRPGLPGLRSLTVIPAGPLPPNPAELLRSPEMQSVLRELAEQVDLIVLDAPPLLPVADAQVLLDLPQIDACLVVARAYQTTREQARRARAVIDRHPLRPVGLVVNGVRERDSGYDYYAPPDDAAPPRRPLGAAQ
jgi:succinoglycan biosynthesis transport protein ExoP